MSVQFGRWSFTGECPKPEYVQKVSGSLAAYGPDSNDSYSQPGITILYRAFHTTKESRRERQPHVCPSGAVITWDGRLDNREELIHELRASLTLDDDVALAGAAFDRWGTGCFAKLIGDWALSIWDSRQRSLILAKDPIGPRHLYYSIDNKQITWCTILDPLVLFADKAFKLCEEYIAGWLSAYPATEITPYVGIMSVPPSSCVFLGPRKHIVAKYWDFDASRKIRYHTDGEYEEHFRTVFAQAVRRRLRSDSPVLGELSGGRDSSSIVCMADVLIARGVTETPRLDTISYYDDSEPGWNERPYFTLVEEKRGRKGWHVDASLQNSSKTPVFESFQSANCCLVPTLGRNGHESASIRMCLASQKNRVILSGTGGDEFMGGVPVPTPELQDLFARARFKMLAHQLKLWALQQRKPWFHLFLEVALRFFPPALAGVPKHLRPALWLESTFVKQHWKALTGYPSRVKLFGPLPSFQDSVSTLNSLRRQQACKVMPCGVLYEKRYPYLDRNLLEFMFAIPREQSVRPTQRRSLMRRALVGIVPDEILNRKRKAVVVRAPLASISRERSNLGEMTQHMTSSSLGIVNSERLFAALENVQHGEESSSLRLMRAIYIEDWLRNLLNLGVLDFGTKKRSQLALHSSING
jgi:asparagine synthase (glutamine-hydrolysing)